MLSFPRDPVHVPHFFLILQRRYNDLAQMPSGAAPGEERSCIQIDHRSNYSQNLFRKLGQKLMEKWIEYGNSSTKNQVSVSANVNLRKISAPHKICNRETSLFTSIILYQFKSTRVGLLRLCQFWCQVKIRGSSRVCTELRWKLLAMVGKETNNWMKRSTRSMFELFNISA